MADTQSESDKRLDAAENMFRIADLQQSPDIGRVAAKSFELGAGEKILAALESKGFTGEQIDAMIEDASWMDHVPEELRDASTRIARLSPEAAQALDDQQERTVRELEEGRYPHFR